MKQYTTQRRRNKFRNRSPIAIKFLPSVWIEGDAVWATCSYISNEGHTLSQAQETLWLPMLAKALKQRYDVDAKNLTIEWDKEGRKYRINFNDNAEFVMLKLIHMRN